MTVLDVLCVGSATLDTIVRVPRIPADDERIEASEIRMAGGGPAATAAVALARLGARVGFCGVIGDDADGRAIRDGLESEGVSTEWVIERPGRSTKAVVMVSDTSSGRSIVTQRADQPRPEEIPVDLAAWLHVDQTGFAVTRRALARTDVPTRLSVDGGNRVDAVDLVGVDLFVPTVSALLERYPSASTTFEALRFARADGSRSVVATAGSHGCLLLGEDGAETELPSFDVPVVSTLGAGDVFHGALLAYLVSGCTLADAARAASAAAALSCSALDGRSGIPDRSTVDALLAAHPLDRSAFAAR